MLCFRSKNSKKLIKPKIRKYNISVSEINSDKSEETPTEQPFYYKKILLKTNSYLSPELRPTKLLKSGITIQITKSLENRKLEHQDMGLEISSKVEVPFRF